MSTRTRTAAVLVAALLALALLAGCGSSSKSDKNTPTTTANKGFDIATPDGQASLSLNGNLPPGWPSAFPVPADAKPAGSGSLGGSSSGAMVGVYTVSGSATDTYNFYASNTDLTVTSSRKVGVGSALVGSVEFSGTYEGSATIAGRNNTTYLVIVLKNSGTSTTTSVPSASTTSTTG